MQITKGKYTHIGNPQDLICAVQSSKNSLDICRAVLEPISVSTGRKFFPKISKGQTELYSSKSVDRHLHFYFP